MGGADIVHFGSGFYGVRDLFNAWVAAGRPPINDAGRTHGEQKYLYDNWRAGKPGFYPADNPDNTSQPRAHMRFAALDIDATNDRVNRLTAAGLRRPYSYEPWHWELPNVYGYPIVYSIPASAADGSAVDFDPANPIIIPEEEEDDMAKNVGISWTRADGIPIAAVFNPVSGFWTAWQEADGAYNTRVAKGFDTNDFIPVSESHANAIERDVRAVRPVPAVISAPVVEAPKA